MTKNRKNRRGDSVKKFKISVYAICKNEEKFIDRWMDAVSEADEVVVLDTGSTDNSIQKLRERGAVVYQEIIDPWRFDEARNRALAKVSPDADICVSNDIDEVFEKGWRAKLEAAWREEYTRARYQFIWSHTPDGKPIKQFPMEKIHCRHGFRWVRPVHEVLAYTGEKPDKTVWVPDLVLHHFPDETKSRGQYLPLLELAVSEDPADDRITFWLGREYLYYQKYHESIETLKKHLALPSATWPEERSAAMRYIARCYDALGNAQEAKSWLYRAVAECPGVREPYIALAWLGYRKKNWPLVYTFANQALKINEPSGSYLTEPDCWGATPYDLGAIAAYHLGMLDKSKALAEEAVKLDPDNERLKNNLWLIEQKLSALREGGEAK